MSPRDLFLSVVVGCAYVRVTAVLLGALRSARARRRARAAEFGIVEFLAALETVVLAAVAYPLYRMANDVAPTPGRTAAAGTGALLAAIYVALLVGSVASWRGVHSGHLVVDAQALVTTGLYGIIRHPLYVGAFVLWVAVAVADLSLIAAAVAILYVTPTYLVYIHREEEMLQGAFGDAYLNYCSRVPRFVPSLRRGRS